MRDLDADRAMLAALPREIEVVEGGYTIAPGEFSLWPVGARGDGDQRIACWIRSREIADALAAAPAIAADAHRRLAWLERQLKPKLYPLTGDKRTVEIDNRELWRLVAVASGAADVPGEETPRCPICGGTKHLPPLAGTVGDRCVKCCTISADVPGDDR